MSEGNPTNPIDAAAEITDAMMSSLADVVKNVISNPDEADADEKDFTEDSDADSIDSDDDNEIVIDTTVEDLVSQGEAAHRSGEHTEALKSFNKAIALDPSNAMAWFNRGVLLEAEQDSRGARQAFVICLDLDPNHGPALANLAVLLDRLGEADGAVEIADRALKYFPGHPHLVKIMDSNKAAGGVLHATPTVMPHTQDKLVNQTLTHVVDTGVEDLFDEESVVSDVEETLAPEIEDVETAHDIPIQDEADIGNEEIQTSEDEVIIETPTQPTINIEELCEEATALLSQGDARGALQTLKEHLHGVAATHFDSWRIAAGSMAALGLDDHAISAYNHAIGLKPVDAKCHFNLGALHERKGNTDAAMKCFSNALDNDNTYMKAASRLATIAESNGDVENLLKARRAMINEDDGKHQLAKLLVELAEGEATILENTNGLPPTIPEGPTLAKEAIGYCEDNSTLLARALSASGDHPEAVKCWKALIQSDKNNPELWTGLARALEAAGDLATAQRCHQKAQGLANPEPAPNDPLDAFAEETTQEVVQPSENNQSFESYQELTQEVAPSPEPPAQVQEPNVLSQPLPELTPRTEPVPEISQPKPEVDLAAAALEATARASENTGIDSNSNSIANQDIEWYNKGVGLIEDKKYREALSCFDRALPSFADNDEMVIRILNGRGNALYYLEDYPKCVESYHKAMVINPKGVQGKTLYNMGTAYAEMQRFGDAIKCFEQAMPRGLDKDQQKLAKEQIRRCNILQKEQQRKMG